jgi:hypothetical protein
MELPKPVLSERLYMILGKLTAYSGSSLVTFVMLAKPCLPPFLGAIYFTNAQTGECLNTSWVSQTLGILWNMWFYMDTTWAFLFLLFHLIGGGMILFLAYFRTLEELLRRNSKGSVHKMREQLLVYQEYRIVMKYWDSCVRYSILPIFLTLGVSLCFMTFYVCLAFSKSIPALALMYFFVLFVNCNIFILVVCSNAANVQAASQDILQSVKHLRGDKHFRAKLRALPELPIQFGQNFIDKETPLVMTDFYINQTVSILLIEST